ncbi:MAG: GNAT family N-acetyltransferase [Bacteroidota bacterium]
MVKRLEIFETERTFLRPFLLEDDLDLFELNANPKVIQFTGDGPFSSKEETRAFIQGYSHYHQYGYGRWAVIRKEDLEFLGWCGLKFQPATEETNLGFRFKQRYWNQGYATETAEACLQIGFNAYELPEVVGRAAEQNLASIRVLEKIGMRYSHTIELSGMLARQYSILKPTVAKQIFPESAVFSQTD